MKAKCAGVPPPEEAARLAEQLKRHEGLRLAAYLDGEGVLTVGYGHNCAAWPVSGVKRPGDGISRDQAERLFQADLELAEAQAGHAMPWMARLNWPRRAALINMTFNMGLGSAASGRGVLGFRRMHEALRRGDHSAAAREMLNSRWAGQVGPRARELAAQMEKGCWALGGEAQGGGHV